ncbi:MAG: hypothetical protein ACPGQL_00305 [Thermoplasmatota archaeon]
MRSLALATMLSLIASGAALHAGAGPDAAVAPGPTAMEASWAASEAQEPDENLILAKETFQITSLAGQLVTFDVPADVGQVYAQFRFQQAAVRDFRVGGPGACADDHLPGAVFLGSAQQTYACGLLKEGASQLDLSVDLGHAVGTVTVFARPLASE